jgi:hypothetical protein
MVTRDFLILANTNRKTKGPCGWGLEVRGQIIDLIGQSTPASYKRAIPHRIALCLFLVKNTWYNNCGKAQSTKFKAQNKFKI